MANIKGVIADSFNLLKGKLGEKTATGDDQQFNLNTFIGTLQEVNSVQQPSRYLVEIGAPGWATSMTSELRTIAFFCDAVNMPGATTMMSEYKKQGYGTFDRRPVSLIMPDLTLSIMLDSNGNNLGFFQRWMTEIQNIDVSKGQQTEAGGSAPFEVKYRSNYIAQITVTTFDMAGTPITKLTAYEAFPSVLGDVALGWNQTDEIARLSVNFQLRYWTVEQLEGTPAGEPKSLSGFEQLMGVVTAGKTLKASWKTPNNVGDAINVISNTQTFLKAFGGG